MSVTIIAREGSNCGLPVEDHLRLRLEQEEKVARDQLHSARKQFNERMTESPNGSAKPEGSPRIHHDGAEVRRLNRLSTQATTRLLNYIVHGTVPEGYEGVE